MFDDRPLPAEYDVLAPDGSEVRILCGLDRGGLAHFQLPAGQTTVAVVHRTVEEIWYVLSGRGEIWRKQHDQVEVTALSAGLCLTIPVGTQFQFRTLGAEPLQVLGVTMPPWPGPQEAVPVPGPWTPTAT